MFWLTAAMDVATTAITLGVIVFLVCLFGIGVGVGRLWNAKWKFNTAGFGISAVLGALAAILIMVHTAMGFINDTLMAPSVRKTMETNLVNDLTGNSRLVEDAFQNGLKNLLATGENVEALSETTQEFVVPGETDEAIKSNKEKFLTGVVKTISGANNQKDKKKKTQLSLKDMQPFCYGYAPISKDADGSLYSALEAELSNYDGLISLATPFWFNVIAKGIVEQSVKGMEKTVCKQLPSQRSSVIVLMIVIMLIQAALISWLAYSDIRPRRINLD